MDADCPTILLSEKIKIHRPWKQSLIIKLLGRSIGYNILLRKIKNLWRPKAALDLVVMDNGFFLVKFSSLDDYELAEYGGPGSWILFNHYLKIRSWQPNFDPEQDTLRNLLVWVRIPRLPIEYYDHNFLMKLDSKIGKPIHVDEATCAVLRGHFACICVDLSKPLLSMFILPHRTRRLEYEGIHLVYFGCRIYGHRKDSCPLEKEQATTVPKNIDNEKADRVQNIVGKYQFRK